MSPCTPFKGPNGIRGFICTSGKFYRVDQYAFEVGGWGIARVNPKTLDPDDRFKETPAFWNKVIWWEDLSEDKRESYRI